MFLKLLIWQDLFAAKLCWYCVWLDLMPVFPLDVPPDRVVPGEGPMTEGTGHPDPLVPLSDVSPQVSLVAVRSFTERTFQFCS